MLPSKPVDISQFKRFGDATTLSSQAIVNALEDCQREYAAARMQLEEFWRYYYTAYCTTPEAKRASLAAGAQKFIGDVKVDWRHELKNPKAYQVVETLVSFFMGAFFPNERWFSVVPEMPIEQADFLKIVELNRILVKDKLDDAKFATAYEIFLREVCILGTSALMFPWVGTNVRFTVLSAFEFLLDPNAFDPNDANLIRTYELTKPELRHYVDRGDFELANKNDIDEIALNAGPMMTGLNFDSAMLQHVTELMGVTERLQTSKDVVEVREFWGDLLVGDIKLFNVRASWTRDGRLLSIVPNPYIERPFIIGTYLRLSKVPYGIGAIQPTASQLYYIDVLTSRHADNVAVVSDAVIEYDVDGVLDPGDIVIRPGAKIPVTKPNSLRPLNLNNGSYQIAPSELANASNVADITVGTGPYIATGSGRNAERVTAEEVAAQRESGGKRLTTVFAGIERDVMVPLLERFHFFCILFYDGNHVTNIQDTYLRIPRQTVQFPMRIKALGASNVAAREYDIRQLMQWLEIVQNNPEFSQRVSWDAILRHITYTFVPANAELFLSPPEQENAPSASVMEGAIQDAQSSAQFLGGNPGVNSVNAALASGTAPQQVQQLQQQLTGGLQ
jgi:hypothetical protein